MYSYIFEGVVTALSSISHIGETHGIHSRLRRETYVQPDHSVVKVPVISGNSLRGLLRDKGMMHMLMALGYGVDERNGTVNGLPLSSFYFLFSGGALTKTGKRGLDIDEARRWRDLLPLVSIFGGAMGNQIMPGKLKVGKIVPICKETAHLLPERFISGNESSIWDYCQEEAYTRKDDEKDERLRDLIEPGERRQLELLAGETRQATRDDRDREVVEETGQKQQMRYYVETFVAGTRFQWYIVLDDVTDLEFDAFCVTMAQFGKMPFIGGKSSIGHGKVSVQFDKWIEINPHLAPQGRELDFSLGAHYMQHLERHADAIRGLIDDLS